MGIGMNKVTFDNTTFYINSKGKGEVSGETIGVSKFYNGFFKWNRRYKPEKLSEEFLQTLI